jgi:hypothetical protein
LLKEGNIYILLATNNDLPVICLSEITSAAEIVWRRRLQSSIEGQALSQEESA